MTNDQFTTAWRRGRFCRVNADFSNDLVAKPALTDIWGSRNCLKQAILSLWMGSIVLIALPVAATPISTKPPSAQDLQPLTPTLTIASDVQLQPINDSWQDTSFVTSSPETTIAQTPPPETKAPAQPTPDLLETSPTFQKWNRQVPNVLDDIKRDPAFRTRARLGLSYFPSTFDSLGWNVGIEDVFIGRTGLTVSADYQATFSGARKAGGGELRYYILPLGGYFNIAPVIGYRYLETPRYVRDGLNVGAKFQAVLSRTGGADISFTQTWVNPRQSEEVGLSKFSFGYALTRNVRLSTDIEKQNSNRKRDTRYGISLEWMF